MRIVLKNSGSIAGCAGLESGLFEIKEYFAAHSPLLVIVIGVLTVILVGLADLVTGAEISLAIFYFVPIAFTTWFAGRVPGLLTALLSAFTWLAADMGNAPIYAHPAIPFWNSAVRLGIFALMAWQLSSIRTLTGNLELAVRKKTALLTAEIQARKELENEVTELTNRQRRDIAYELHDGLCPQLGGIALKAKILQDTLADRDSTEAHRAGELVSLLKTANQHARLLARGLDPIAVELHGLISALRKLAGDTQELYRVGCIFRTDLESAPVSPSTALQLYRIAQEAIHNAVAHGRAGRIQLELLNGNTDLRLKITDDGKGFVPERGSTEGMGMRIMRFRAECVGAALRIESWPNLGTTVECRLAA